MLKIFYALVIGLGLIFVATAIGQAASGYSRLDQIHGHE